MKYLPTLAFMNSVKTIFKLKHIVIGESHSLVPSVSVHDVLNVVFPVPATKAGNFHIWCQCTVGLEAVILALQLIGST